MFPPFPQELAHHYCKTLISRLDNGTATLQQTGRESLERKTQGVMVGSLVCRDKLSNKIIVLYAVSGNGKKLLLTQENNNIQADGQRLLEEIVVPSLVSPENVETALEEFDKEIHILTDKINKFQKGDERNQLIKKRTELTDISLRRVFNLYSFTRFDKKKISLNEIIEKHNGKLPPTGTGDCCEPKLLSYAFENNLQPLSIDEVYYGPDTKTKINGKSYDPCNERCGYILPYILGLEILYRDNSIIIVNKESGLLSVPGKGPEHYDSVETRVRFLFPETIKQPAVHRLDMETSGILILAFTKEAHRELNRQFSEGLVQKKYAAVLEGIIHGIPYGKIELKTRLDINNRPVQIIDNEKGKLGITEWKKLGIRQLGTPSGNYSKKGTLIEFTPLTGRTHQLRLAAKYGLNMPIYGDSLYSLYKPTSRLMLHAFYIKFYHPVTHKIIEITTEIPF